MDFSNGRYIARNPNGQQIGRIDEDGFVRSGTKLLFRVDGDEIYTVGDSAELVGFIEGSNVSSPNGELLFTLHAE